MSYDMIDRFLRNNLGDDDYAKYSDALNALCTPQRTWVGLSDDEMWTLWNAEGNDAMNQQEAIAFAKSTEAKLKQRNT